MIQHILEIRPYMYETLMYLVGIHAQVSKAAEPLLDRTLSALVNELAEESLRCFRQVKRFGMGGMLRVGFPTSADPSVLIFDLLNRQLWKLSSCIKPWAAMLRHLQLRHYQTYITRSPKPTHDGREMRTFRVTSMGSRRRWQRRVAPQGSNSYASGKPKRRREHPLLLGETKIIEV